MRKIVTSSLWICLLGCSALGPQTTDSIHEALKQTGAAVTTTGEATGSPLLILIGQGIGLLATAFVAYHGTAKIHMLAKHAIPGSPTTKV